MLKIQFKDKRQEPIWVIEKRYTIGSAVDNHLVVTDQSMSPLHARLLTQDNALYLKDNNSEQGCYVNEQRVTEKQILPGDTIRLGKIEFEILDPRESISQQALADDAIPPKWSLVADSSWLSGQEYQIPVHTSTVGRGSQCDIVIPGTHLSRQHAQLTIKGNLLHVRDLASANGTYINDERVTEGIARPGDRLRMDVYSFRLIGPESENDKTRVRRVRQPNHTPVERKAISTEPKQWITKPTSPGNRIEPTKGEGFNWALVVSVALCVIVVAVLAYLFVPV
ncbi:MAG: FHA domain-containing protein [Cellvibrionaceae bacterium]